MKRVRVMRLVHERELLLAFRDDCEQIQDFGGTLEEEFVD